MKAKYFYFKQWPINFNQIWTSFLSEQWEVGHWSLNIFWQKLKQYSTKLHSCVKANIYCMYALDFTVTHKLVKCEHLSFSECNDQFSHGNLNILGNAFNPLYPIMLMHRHTYTTQHKLLSNLKIFLFQNLKGSCKAWKI